MFENKVIIIGNLTRKPELKKTASDVILTGLSIAVNSVYYDKNTNEKKESCEFISVTVFGKVAENCAMFLEKGQKVYVEGKIKNRVEDTEAGKRYHTGIIASRVQFGSRANGPTSSSQNNAAIKTPEDREPEQSGFTYPEEDINPNDIPF